MRKAFFVSLVTLWCVFVYAQPTISDLTFPNSVDVFGLFEMSFQLGKYDNPYDPDVIDVYAEFTAPDGKSLKVNGFYYEGYTFQQKDDYEVASASRDKGWRVRFTPNQAGKWSFSLHAVDRKGKTVLSSSDKYPLSFECRSVDTALGFIRKANTRYLKREVMQNGVSKYQAFFPIGPNVAWYDYKGSRYYPKGIYVEYARYYSGLSLYHETPDPRLDQSNTMEAINELQNFLDLYPYTSLKEQTQEMIYQLQDKLVEKEYLSAKLYYDLGTYMGNSLYGGSNYEACVVRFSFCNGKPSRGTFHSYAESQI